MNNGSVPHIQVMPRGFQKGVGTLSWGLFFIIAAAAVFIAMGIPFGPITLFAGIVALFFAFTYPVSWHYRKYSGERYSTGRAGIRWFD